ncbi:unnamed protein product [Sphacelaria rigidula]
MKQHAGYTGNEAPQLAVSPHVTPEIMSGLPSENDNFLIAASGTHSDYGLLSFWDDKKYRIPSWCLVAINFVFTQPSSASMERVFPIFSECLSSQQDKAR